MPGAKPNNSFNRSGDCVSFMLFCPSKVEWIRAARLIRALGAFRFGFLRTTNHSPRFNKLLPLLEFENQLYLFLKWKRSQRASVLLLLLNDFANVRVLSHGLNLYSLSFHLLVSPCRFKTAFSERLLTAPRSKNMLIRK